MSRLTTLAHLSPDDMAVVGELAAVLNNTMEGNAAIRQPASDALKALGDGVDRQVGYLPLLLKVIHVGLMQASTVRSSPMAPQAPAASAIDGATISAAAVQLKNTVSHSWDPRQAEHHINETDKAVVREQIFHIMVLTNVESSSVRGALSHAISSICAVDFPTTWPGIVNLIVNQMTVFVDDMQRCLGPAVGSLAGASPGLTLSSTAAGPGGMLHSVMHLRPDHPGLLQTTLAHIHALRATMATAHSVFCRYRKYDELSRVLQAELLQLNTMLTRPHLVVMEAALQSAKNLLATAAVTPASNTASHRALQPQLAAVLDTLRDSLEVFWDVTYIDMTDDQEKLLRRYVSVMLECFELRMPPAVADCYDASTVYALDATQSSCLQVATFYMQKYDDEFGPFVREFGTIVWRTLKAATTTTPAAGGASMSEELIVSSLSFLETWVRGAGTALDAAMTSELCESVIVPCLLMRDVDEEHFVDEPLDYIQRELEGSAEIHSRRRGSIDLARALLAKPEASAAVAAILKSRMEQLFTGTWRERDAAIQIATALLIKGTVSASRGTTELASAGVDLGQFFTAAIMPLLLSSSSAQPSAADVTIHVLQADALRFTTIFRHHIPFEQLPQIWKCLWEFIKLSTCIVVRCFAAYCVDRLMLMPPPADAIRAAPRTAACLAGVPTRFPLAPEQLGLFLAALCDRLNLDAQLIEHTPLCLTRLIRHCPKESVHPFVGDVISSLVAPINAAAKNPSNPLYSHYLFEALSSAIALAPELTDAIEAVLWPSLVTILSNDILEFLPYTLQIIAQLLDSRPQGTPVPDHYMGIYAPLMTPVLYEEQGNIPAIVRVLCAFVRRGATQIHQASLTEKTFGVFQMLNSRKQHDHEAFNLLTTIVQSYPPALLDPFMGTVFGLVFGRLQAMKTAKYVRCLAIFLSALAIKRGAAYLESVVAPIQPGIFAMLLKVWLPVCPKVHGAFERKVIVIAMAELAANTASPSLAGGAAAGDAAASALWAQVVFTGLKVIHLAVENDDEAGHFAPKAAVATAEDISRLDNLLEAGATNKFCPLLGAQRPPDNPLPSSHPCAVQEASMGAVPAAQQEANALRVAQLYFVEKVRETARALPMLAAQLQRDLPQDALQALN